MTLDAGVGCLNVVHARRIQSVAARWMLDVLASRAMAFLSADVPLRHLFRVDGVTDGVAAVACRSCGTLHIVGRIKRFPPVGSFGHEIRPPNAVGDVPLSRLGEIIVTTFCEVALLPHAAVHERE